jgi:myo-inositol-1(or 4)-monophosphatase
LITPSKTDLLQTAILAAREAGTILKERLSAEREIHVKGLRDIVTDVDPAAEKAIVHVLQNRFPDHAVLGEEGGKSAGDQDFLWVIDPLDGTTNYSRRFPGFSVSIGLLHKGQPWVGVVHDPLRDQTFAATRGLGATLNDEPLKVSPHERVGQAVIGLDWAHSDTNRRQIVAHLGRVAPACRTLRAIGSAALGLSYVACGWIDAYFHIELELWDMAAGLLLITEAGGRVTDLRGGPWAPGIQKIVVSNGHIHQELLTLLQTDTEHKTDVADVAGGGER